MEKPKIDTDYNSRMGSVDLSEAYLTSYHSTRKSLKEYYQKHFPHLTDICCLNSYLHFLGGGGSSISSKTYRTSNFKISYNRRETVRQFARNCPTNKEECFSLSLLHCCHSVKGKSVSVLCCVMCYKKGQRSETGYNYKNCCTKSPTFPYSNKLLEL
jgi:hypothetical protein